MRKFLRTMLIALTALALAAPAPAEAQAAPAPPATPTPAGPAPAPKKEIKDPAEYNSYVAAIQQQDPQAKIAGLLDFVQRYPNSAYKEDALEQLMALHQGMNDGPKTMAMANQILQAFPNNIRALALMAYSKRVAAQSGQNPQQNQKDLSEARELSERGLQALKTAAKPEGMAEADFEKFKSQVAVVFNGTTGLWSLQNKNYADAQEHLRAAVNGNPNDFKDVYPLALAYLSAKPSDDLNGLWFAARSVNLATAAGFPAQSVSAIAEFGRKRFIKYHGGEDGWAELLAQTKNTTLPPAGFTIPPAPTPAEQAKALADSKDPKQMNFAEWELVLGAGEPAVADKVWSVIKGQTVQFAGKVIGATKTTLLIAATVDAIEQNQPDVEVSMAAPLTLRMVPKPGSDIEILAVPVSYTAQPFVMKMSKGALRPPTPPRRAGRRR